MRLTGDLFATSHAELCVMCEQNPAFAYWTIFPGFIDGF